MSLSIDHLGEQTLHPDQCTCSVVSPVNLPTVVSVEQLSPPTVEQLRCQYCERAFKLKTHLLLHESSHTGIGVFACPICKSSFALKGMLIRHIKMHSVEEQDRSLTLHHRVPQDGAQARPGSPPDGADNTASQVRRHPCDYCSKDFEWKHQLASHIIDHLNDPECSMRITRRAASATNQILKRPVCDGGDTGGPLQRHLTTQLGTNLPAVGGATKKTDGAEVSPPSDERVRLAEKRPLVIEPEEPGSRYAPIDLEPSPKRISPFSSAMNDVRRVAAHPDFNVQRPGPGLADQVVSFNLERPVSRPHGHEAGPLPPNRVSPFPDFQSGELLFDADSTLRQMPGWMCQTLTSAMRLQTDQLGLMMQLHHQQEMKKQEEDHQQLVRAMEQQQRKQETHFSQLDCRIMQLEALINNQNAIIQSLAVVKEEC